jgi:tetratricopeptide (TPR) repeat protein
VFYDLKRKRYFYYHEINQTMEAEPPVDVVFPSPLAVLAVHENLRCSCLELLHRRVRLIRPNANRITEVELAEELFGPMVIIQDPIEPKAYSTHLDIEELLEVNLSYHKSRYGRQAKWTRGWKAAYGILRTLRSMKRIASTAQTLLLTPTSRPYTQSSAPVSRLVSTATKAKLHVGGFFSAAKGLHSPETLSTSRQIDPVSKTSLIKIIVISIWNSLNKKENVTLRNEVFSKHFMISIIRQRNLFEGCRTSGEELDLDANALGTSSILSPPRSLTSSVAVALKRLPMGSSLDNTLVSYFEAEQKFHAPEFERNLSNEDYTHYQSILGDVNQAPQSVEPLLHLVGFLFNCGADMPATRCLKKIIDDLPLYKLVEVEKTYIEILHLHCVTKVMGRYPRAHTLKDLATKHPTDAGVLALVATELAALQYIQDAETYYIASLLREPINNAIALRGYALLLANIKGDYAGALRYLSRISPQICDAGVLGVIKLETAWCSELAGNNDCISLQYYSSIAIHATPKTILSLVHSCMAAILIRKKDYIHACEYLIKALKLFSDNPHALIQHACLRLHRGIEHTRICDEYFLRGVDLLESLKFPTLWLVRLAYGDFKAFAMNDFIAAETLYRKSAYCRKSILPIIAYTQNLLLCKQSNDIIQANLDWARSILNFLKPSVDVSFALVSIACVCVHMGEMDKAMALLGGLKGNDGYVLGSAHRCQAYLASKMDHRKEAANHLENALSVGSVNPAVLRSCAAQYASIGEFQRAYELISRATEVDYHEPHSWEMQAILAYLLEADLSHCLTFLDMSLGIIFDFDVFRLRGQVLFETGRVTEARETLEAALRHKPKDAICLISLILVYEAMWRKVCDWCFED